MTSCDASTWRSGRAAEGDGLENRCTQDVTPCSAETYDSSRVELGVLLGVLERECPELAAIVAAWPTLPDPIRAAILAMVEAVAGGESASE